MRVTVSFAVVAAGLLLALAAGGCGRRTTLSRAGADSSEASARDSIALLARDAQSGWESGAPEDAARTSAALLLADLARHPADHWEVRTHTLLDSLAIGADVVTVPCLEAVNFFTRANPDAGSWPYLFWCGDARPHSQEIEGRGLHLVSAALAPVSVSTPGEWEPVRPPFAPRRKTTHALSASASAVALLFSHRAGGGQQPLVMVWSHARSDDPWNLVQTLGADSLGGVGTGEFEPGDTLTLVTRTYQPSRGFDECTTCPHLFRTRRFRWRDSGFVRIEEQRVSSPYATFVLFIAALSVDDRDAAERVVTDPDLVERARRLEWGRPKGAWRVAPETDETAAHMVFFRGREEAYRVEFTPQGGDWKISGFEPTARNIE